MYFAFALMKGSRFASISLPENAPVFTVIEKFTFDDYGEHANVWIARAFLGDSMTVLRYIIQGLFGYVQGALFVCTSITL